MFVVIVPLLARFLFVLLFKVWCVEILTLGFVLEPRVGIVRSPPLIVLGALLITEIHTPSFGSGTFLLIVF